MSSLSSKLLKTVGAVSAFVLLTTPQLGHSARYGRVTEMRLEASRSNYVGPCPVTIGFHGSITVDGPNTVTYGVQRSDGATGEGQQTLHFAAAGTKPVHYTWRLGSPGENFRGWVEIGSGNTHSNRAAFQIHCRK
jgi:hypothetical protein